MRDNEPASLNNSWQGRKDVVHIYEMKVSKNQFKDDMGNFPQYQASFLIAQHKYHGVRQEGPFSWSHCVL